MTVDGPFVIIAKPVGPICSLECDYCYYLPKTEMYPSTERCRMSPEVLEAHIVAFIEACPGPTCTSCGTGANRQWRESTSTVGLSLVFRIDHFLGKEAIDNILALRFANGLFEPV